MIIILLYTLVGDAAGDVYVPTRCTYLYRYYHVPGTHEGLILESFAGTTESF